MAWQTKLKETDYQVSTPRPGHLAFFDVRNRKGYNLAESAMDRLRAKYGISNTSDAWVKAAINEALIPHPYDEYV